MGIGDISPEQMVRMIGHYRRFAAAVYAEDSGLAVWEEHEFDQITSLAKHDERERLEADGG